MRAKKAKKTDVKYEIHYGLKKSLEFMESPLSICCDASIRLMAKEEFTYGENWKKEKGHK